MANAHLDLLTCLPRFITHHCFSSPTAAFWLSFLGFISEVNPLVILSVRIISVNSFRLCFKMSIFILLSLSFYFCYENSNIKKSRKTNIVNVHILHLDGTIVNICRVRLICFFPKVL